MTKEQDHQRKKANPTAQDEKLTVPKKNELSCTPNQVLDLLQNILAEKEKLTKAIEKAKTEANLNIDSAIAINKQKQEVCRILSRISEIKSSERIVRGTDYKFNVNGDQVSYNYDIHEVLTIDFDRNKVKAIVKKLKKETDEISNEIDKLEVSLEVKHEPLYDINDSFEDILLLTFPKEEK